MQNSMFATEDAEKCMGAYLETDVELKSSDGAHFAVEAVLRRKAVAAPKH